MTQLPLPFPHNIPVHRGAIRVTKPGWLVVFLDNGTRIGFQAGRGIYSFTPAPVSIDPARTFAQLSKGTK